MTSTEILEVIETRRLLTSLAVDSLVKTYQLLEKASELKVKEAGCGARCLELWGKLDPITSSLKTAQCSLFEDSRECYATFPKSGMMSSGNVYLAPTLAYNRVGNDYIVLPTPTKSTANGACKNRYFGSHTYRGNHTRVYPGWRTRQSIPSPRFAGKHNELPDRVDRTHCLGNAVQPIVAHYLFECIKEFDRQVETN